MLATLVIASLAQRPSGESPLSALIVAVIAIAQYSAALAVSLVWIPLIVLAALLLPSRVSCRAGPALARSWGRIMLHLCRCTLEVSPAARAVLTSRAPRLLTINHTSTLDLFIGGTIMPEAGVTVAKREIIWLPLVGVGLWAVGSIFIDRSHPKKARASLAAAAERIRSDRLQVLIAPEGTRSLDGQLGRFKLGAFHLAQQAEIPIMPLVLHNCAELWPRSKRAPKKGVVWITCMDEVSPADMAGRDPHDVAAELRAAYVAALAEGPAG